MTITVHTFTPNPAADIAAYLAEDGEFSARCAESGAYGLMVQEYEDKLTKRIPDNMYLDWSTSPTTIVYDGPDTADPADLTAEIEDMFLGIEIGAIINKYDPDVKPNTGACCGNRGCGYSQPL